MTVAIPKIAGTDRHYLAYASKFAGRATCFVYFQDNLWGAVPLHNSLQCCASPAANLRSFASSTRSCLRGIPRSSNCRLSSDPHHSPRQPLR